MLTRTQTVPTDKRVAGVHIIPFTADANVVMGWNRERGLLETLGGCVEAGESYEEALRREAMEEAGITVAGPFRPIASYYWESTDTYTVWFIGRVVDFGAVPPGFETSGRVVCNVETAKGIIQHLPHDKASDFRLNLLAWAEEEFLMHPS